ncbi:MAG: peptidase C39 [Lachnospiraceae bacterium]|nr:peptidase C39 [Lachnospiraceae bacterium]
MKNPLHYQISDYDCGPTSMLNAISFLFQREEIPPEIIRNIMIYCLDCYNIEGIAGKSGTSRVAMMFLSNWLNGFGHTKQLPISSRYISGKSVYLGGESYINDTLRRGGAVVIRLFLDEWHYVLFTGAKDENIYVFDPYFHEESYEDQDIVWTLEHPEAYNCIVPEERFNSQELMLYALGPYEGREAVLLFNEKTVITADDTIEYFI